MECNETHVTVNLTDISIAAEWRAGIPFVGGRDWGCVGLPLVPVGGSASPRALPFYRRIKGVLRDHAHQIVVVNTQVITIFEIFQGTVQVKHVPPRKPGTSSTNSTKRITKPMHTFDEQPTAGHRKLQSSGSCSDHSGNCGVCLQSSEAGSFYGTYSCAYCTGDQTCVSNNPANSLAVCTGKWLGGDGDNVCSRCESESCEENSRCPSTNDNQCDEFAGGCPVWTDENDCSGSRFNTFNGGCEYFEGSNCARCLEAPAVGGGYCGWNPDLQDCMTSRAYYADGYGRCDPCPDHYIDNGVCDGPPGW
eukprot:SAG11_NODE_3721_length_2261_cov_2.231730_1_plen_306_part_00